MIEKQKNILEFALSSLLRRWKKNVALLFVYTFVVFIIASVIFFIEALKREAFLVLEGAPDVVVQRLVAGRHALVSCSHMEKLRSITGVSDVKGRLWAYYYEPSVRANYTLVVTPEASRQPGRVAIGAGVSRTLHADKGDLIEFRGHDGSYVSFEVARIFPSSSELVSADLVELSDEDFRSLFGLPDGSYTDIVLQVRNPKETITAAHKIRKLLPDTRPILREDMLRTYEALFDWRGGIVLAIFAGAGLAFLIFAWDKATSLSLDERREIGILKAVGWETSEVLAMKSWEGIAVSLTAFLIGASLAYIHVFFASGTLFEPVLKGWAVLYPRFCPVPFIDPYQIATLFFLTVAPYTVATVIPSWGAATIDPDTVMRQ
ncbi:FtsX-like permease family protein [Syntrophus gentianae]|uniref:FtsX-like permease family protein n=1 Tax=Syntrophus gentianae TaxID=43775 RepID=A0A1H8AFB5_9BACT|nr:FtsX-like permease family protein [Syntrophus gentianae]SEM68528.1 FtsX-like permease family protein [Syntrophus gentianae]